MVLEVLYEVPMLLGRLCATSDNSRLFGQNSPSCAHTCMVRACAHLTPFTQKRGFPSVSSQKIGVLVGQSYGKPAPHYPTAHH